MKKIINKKMYNTDTATYVGEYWDGNCGDVNYVNEELYQKRNGEFFLIGEGGPYSRYGERDGSSIYGTINNFIPLTESEAKEWVEKHLSAEKYIELFGEPTE